MSLLHRGSNSTFLKQSKSLAHLSKGPRQSFAGSSSNLLKMDNVPPPLATQSELYQADPKTLLTASDGDGETRPQPDFCKGHAGHASRQNLFPALLVQQYSSRTPTSANLPIGVFHCMLLVTCLLACYWLQRKNYKGTVFIYHAIPLKAAFCHVSIGLDRASQFLEV